MSDRDRDRDRDGEDEEARFRACAFVEAPRLAVFDLLVEPEARAAWDPRVERVEIVRRAGSDERPVEWRATRGGVASRQQLIAIARPLFLAIRTTCDAGSWTMQYTLHEDAGCTFVDIVFEPDWNDDSMKLLLLRPEGERFLRDVPHHEAEIIGAHVLDEGRGAIFADEHHTLN